MQTKMQADPPVFDRVVMTEEEYARGSEEGLGVCRDCGEVVEGGVEPDARDYKCPRCGRFDVWGIEGLLTIGEVEFTVGI
jgi:predicted RNA-binding Zn-ribbon protein involved in translation (DUF1610 family)